MSSETPDPPEVVSTEARPTAVVTGTVPMQELPAFFDRAFGTIGAALAANGVAPAGPAHALYHRPPADVADLEVGFPVTGHLDPDGEVSSSTLPAGRVARLVHRGAYDELGSSWERLRGWVDERGLGASDTMWEVYVTEPSPEMDPADLVTELNWLLET